MKRGRAGADEVDSRKKIRTLRLNVDQQKVKQLLAPFQVETVVTYLCESAWEKGWVVPVHLLSCMLEDAMVKQTSDKTELVQASVALLRVAVERDFIFSQIKLVISVLGDIVKLGANEQEIQHVTGLMENIISRDPQEALQSILEMDENNVTPPKETRRLTDYITKSQLRVKILYDLLKMHLRGDKEPYKYDTDDNTLNFQPKNLTEGVALMANNFCAMQYTCLVLSTANLVFFGDQNCPKRNLISALLYKITVDRGNAMGHVHLGFLYEKGQGVEQSFQMAFSHIKSFCYHYILTEIESYFQTAAKAGLGKAAYIIGHYYARGKGGVVPRSDRKAIKWLRRGAAQGEVEAQFYLGFLLTQSTDVSLRNFPEAVEYYKMATKQGHASAAVNLARIHKHGKFGRTNYTKAAKYFKLSIKLGSTSGALDLGDMYFHGDGVPLNKEKAWKYFTVAADAGSDTAKFRLGQMQYKGDGVPQNIRSALERWAKASSSRFIANKLEKVLQVKLFSEDGCT